MTGKLKTKIVESFKVGDILQGTVTEKRWVVEQVLGDSRYLILKSDGSATNWYYERDRPLIQLAYRFEVVSMPGGYGWVDHTQKLQCFIGSDQETRQAIERIRGFALKNESIFGTPWPSPPNQAILERNYREAQTPAVSPAYNADEHYVMDLINRNLALVQDNKRLQKQYDTQYDRIVSLSKQIDIFKRVLAERDRTIERLDTVRLNYQAGRDKLIEQRDEYKARLAKVHDALVLVKGAVKDALG